ncbi:hypothetical protein, partial [Methanospirillum purgamenti]
DRQYTFGLVGDVPITGDWNGDGKTSIGVFRGRTWYLDYNGNGVWNGPTVDRQYTFGLVGDVPVTGVWSGTSGTASIVSIKSDPIKKPDNHFKFPSVSKSVAPVSNIPVPVMSDSYLNPSSTFNGVMNKNPLAVNINGLG